jgi:hypothetical protein
VSGLRKANEEVQRRINETMLTRVGTRASQIEFRIHVIRLWNGAWLTFAAALTIIARILDSWIVLGVAIAAYVFAVSLTVRIFVLRHQFFQAASEDLGTKVNMRHPVRGYPNWRRPLSSDQLNRLNREYDAWCKKRGITGLRSQGVERAPRRSE